jgi:hypothetical protein
MCDLVRARWWTGRSAAVIAAALVTTLLGPGAAMAQIPANAKLPDLMTMIPQQLQIVNPAKGSKREVLRFSNGIANIGGGPVAYAARASDAGSQPTPDGHPGAPGTVRTAAGTSRTRRW